jgi:hypothetical protein
MTGCVDADDFTVAALKAIPRRGRATIANEAHVGLGRRSRHGLKDHDAANQTGDRKHRNEAFSNAHEGQVRMNRTACH